MARHRLFALAMFGATVCAAAAGQAHAQPPAPGALDPARVHALVINGGGDPAQNYQSHLLHVKAVLERLRAAGVPEARITVFSSDGSDPAPDLAVRRVQPEAGFYMLEGTGLGGLLRTPITFEDSRLPGVHARPATRAALWKWVGEAKSRLKPDDTLFLYVTDHGTRGRDPRNNEITLWGKGEKLTVDELGRMLGGLPGKVRVLSLMSQCFSGGFARLYASRPARDGQGGFCGFFASTPERPAYGCYPENLDKNNVGHSFHFLAALGAGRGFSAAHREVLTTDQTPDVPLATSEVYLEDLLTRAASARPLGPFVDELLREALRAGKTWEPQLRLLDGIGQRFGLFSARSLGELDAQAGKLPVFLQDIEARREAWQNALTDLNVGRLDQVLTATPALRARVQEKAVLALGEADRRKLTAELLDALGALERDRERLATIKERHDLSKALAYRLEVRQGVVLRMRAQLINLAGQVYLATRASAEEKARFAALTACEGVTLPGGHAASPLAEPAAFPPFADDLALAERVLPAWMGINFAGVGPEAQKAHDLPSGAALVRGVFNGSPAEAAGLRPGDIVLGTKERQFTGHNEVRVWTFLSVPGQKQQLQVFRGGQRVTLDFVPGKYPGKLPSLPGPPKPGVKAPALSLAPYRGGPLPPLHGKPHLLFFWATYCGPCKASLPEVLAFAEKTGTPVLAISDEPRETLDEFFAAWKKPFPRVVAHDELRQTFVAYGTSGVPTFVYVGADGVIKSHVSGYGGGTRGIGVPGWNFSQR